MTSPRAMNLLRHLYRRLPRPPSTNYNLRQLSYNPYDELKRGAIVLDIGSKSAQGQYAAFATGPGEVSLISLDLAPSEGVGLVGDAHALPLKAQSVDCVFCIGMLMHCEDPKRVVAEIFRVLKPGGLFYINTAFVFRYTPDPTDYYRFSVDGLRVLSGSFEVIQSGFNRGPASTMCDLLVHFSAIICCFNNRRAYTLLVDIFQWSLFWIKYLDRWIGRYTMAHIIHNGAFFFGRKPIELESKSSS